MADLRPDKLYQFRQCSRQNLEGLANRELWFSSYDRLNDPLDAPGIVDLSQIQKQRLVDIYHEPTTDEFTSRLNPIPPKRGSDWDQKWRLLHVELNSQLESAGVACFSEIYGNLPMWTHYAADHTGYCLEFATHEEPLSGAERICYVAQLAAFDPYTRQHPENEAAVPLLTKHSDWSYEKEWRVIAFGHANSSIRYPISALTGVYLGSHMSPWNEARLRNVIAGASMTPEYYRMRVEQLALARVSAGQ